MDLGDTETASIPTPLSHTDPDESKSVTAQGANPDCGVDSERPMSESEPPPQILWESHPAQTVSISPLPNIDPEESESVLKLETAPCPEVDPENTNSDSVPCQTQEEFDSAQKPSEQQDPVPGLILLTDLSFPTVSETALCLGPQLDPCDMRGSEDPISALEPPQIDEEPDPELASMPRPTPHLHIDSRELEAMLKLGPDPSPDTDSENPRSTTETPPELQGEPDPAEQPDTALTSMTELEVDLASPAVSCSVSCVGQPDLCNGMRSENPMPASEPLQIEIEKCPNLVQIQSNDPLPHLDSQEFEPVPPHKSDPAQTGLQPEQPTPVSLTVKTEPGLSSLAILYPAAYIRQEPGVETLKSDSQGRDRILEGFHLRCLQPQSQSLPYFPPIQSPTYLPVRPQQSPSISNGPCPVICHSILIPSCPPLDLPPDFPSYHPQMNHNCPQPGPNRPSLTPQPRTNFLSLAPQLRPNHLQPPPDLQLGPGLPGPLPGSIPSQTPPPQAWCRSEGFPSRGMFENYRWWQNLRDMASKIYPDSGPDAEALACFFIPVIRSLCLQYPSLLFTQGISVAVGEWRKLSNYDRMEYYHLAQKFVELEVEEVTAKERSKVIQRSPSGTGQSGVQAELKGYTGKSSATTSAKETETKCNTRVNQAKDKTQRATKSRSGPRVPRGRRLGKVDIKVLEERALGEYTAAMEALLIDPTGVRDGLEVRNQEEEGDEKKNDEEEEGGGDGEGSFTEYLNELCSQKEFVTKVGAVLDLQYLSSLLTSDPDTIDLLSQEEAQVDQEMPDVPASVTCSDPEAYTTHTASEGCTAQQQAPSLTEHREALSPPMTSYELQFERHCMSMSTSIHHKSRSTPNYDNHNAPDHGPPLFIQTQDGCTVSYLIPPTSTSSPSETFRLATSQDGLFQLQGPCPPPQPGINYSHNAPFPLPAPHLRAFPLPPLPVSHKNYNYHNAPPPQGFFVLPENYSPHPIPMAGQDAFQMCPPQHSRHFVFSEDSPEGGPFVFIPMGDYVPHNAPLPMMMMNSPSPFPFSEHQILSYTPSNQTSQQTQYHYPNNTIAVTDVYYPPGALPVENENNQNIYVPTGPNTAYEAILSHGSSSIELSATILPVVGSSGQYRTGHSASNFVVQESKDPLSITSVLDLQGGPLQGDLLASEPATSSTTSGVLNNLHWIKSDQQNYNQSGQQNYNPRNEANLSVPLNMRKDGLTFTILPLEREEDGVMEGMSEEEEDSGDSTAGQVGDVPKQEDLEEKKEEEEGGREEEEQGGREEEGREEEEGGREEGVVLSPIQTYPFPSPPPVSSLGPPTPIASPSPFPLAAYHGGRRMLTENPPFRPPNLRFLAMAALIHSVSSTPPEGQGDDNKDEGQLNWKPQDPRPFQLSHPARDRDRVTPPSGHGDGDTPCTEPIQSFIMAVSCSTPRDDPFLDAHLTGWVRDTPNPAGEGDPEPLPLWAPASLSDPTEEPQIGEGSLEHRPQLVEGPRLDGTRRGMEVEAADKGGEEEWRVIDTSSFDGPNTETSDSFNAKTLDCVNSSARDGNNAVASDMRISPQASDICISSQASDMRISAQASDIRIRSQASDMRISPQASDMRISPQASDIRISSQASDIRISPQASDMRISPQASDMRISPQASDMCISPQASDMCISPQASDMRISSQASDMRISSQASDMRISPQASDMRISSQASGMRISPQASDMRISPQASDMRISPQASDICINPQASDMRISPQASDMRVSSQASDMHMSSQASDMRISSQASGMRISLQASDMRISSQASDMRISPQASDICISPQASGLDRANVKALNRIDLKVTNVSETNPPDNVNTQATDSAIVQATDTTITEAPCATNSGSSATVNEKLTDVITATEASGITESCGSAGGNKPSPDSPAIDCVKEFADLSTVPIITQVDSDTESSPPSISSTDLGSTLLSDCVSETVEEAYPRMEETWNQPIEGVNLDESMSDSQAPIPGLLHPHSAWDESTPLPLCLDATGVNNDQLQSYMPRDSTRETANISTAHTLLTLGQVEVEHSLTPASRGSAETETEGETVLGGTEGQMESDVKRENGVETGEEAEMERKEIKQQKRETESEVETTQTGQWADADRENTEMGEREEEERMKERNEIVGRLEETPKANPSRNSKRSTRHQKQRESRRRKDTMKTEERKKEIENEKEVVKKMEKMETREVAVKEEEGDVIATENKMEEKTEKKKQSQSRKGRERQAVNREQAEEKEQRSDKEVQTAFKAATAPNINTDKVKVTLKEPQQHQGQKTEADRETLEQRDEAKDKTQKPGTMTGPMIRARRSSKAAEKGKEVSSKTAKQETEKEDEAKRTEKPRFIPSPMITTRRKSKATEKEKPKPGNTMNKVTSVEMDEEEDEGKEQRSERPSPLTPVTRKKRSTREKRKPNTKKETGGETEKQRDEIEERTENPCRMTSTATSRMITTRGNWRAEECKKEQNPRTAKKEAMATTPNIYTVKEREARGREEREDVPTSGKVTLKELSPMTRTKLGKNDVERKDEKEPSTANMEIDGESEKIEKPSLRSPVTRARRKDVEGKKEDKPKTAEKETGKQGNETKEERTEKSFPIPSPMTRTRHAKAVMGRKEQKEESANTAEKETGKQGDKVEEQVTENLKSKTVEGEGTIENDAFVTNRGLNRKGMKRKAGESGDMEGKKGRQGGVQSKEGSHLGLKKLKTKNRRGLTEESTSSSKAKIEKVETDAKITGNRGTTENKIEVKTIPASRTKHSEGKREIETVLSPVTERRTGKTEGGKRKGETLHPPIPATLSKVEEDEPTQAEGHTSDEKREKVEPKRKQEIDRARERWSQRVGKRQRLSEKRGRKEGWEKQTSKEKEEGVFKIRLQ
ncbi:uncharacterized protein LOC115194576 isoform X1 [Salmo trutta]|uniref:Uncharacterized LOC115194576 n=2 Tax=Salmo trutta TaxID=8032 RepID=A0A673WAK2_SALTR|nr:uncharacterized protein LOC115194576 isoform X1 [Salmo trutta]